MLPPRLTAAAPFLFVFLWSTGFIGAKYGLPHAGPLSFLLVRYALVVSLLLALVAATRAPWPKDRRVGFHIGVAGIMIHGLYLGGVFTAIGAGLPAGIAALIVGLQPILTAFGAAAWLGERVVVRQWIGLALGLAGVALVLAGKGLLQGAAPSAPMLIPIVVALFGITIGTLYQKRFCPHFDLRTGAVLQFIPAAIATLIALPALESFRVDWTGDFVFALLWLSLVLSIGAISLLNLLIRQGSAVNVARLFFLTPPTTALIAWAMFGESLPLLALAGMGIAVAGVYLSRSS
jgi:drug/metabolite transporter (DMT)-like permease